MKHISKNFLKNKNVDKKLYYKKNIAWLFSFLFIFFLGIWTERFNLELKILSFSENLTNTLSNRVYSAFNMTKTG